MPELFDTSWVPDDPAHWDALAERVAANAASASTGGGFEWLAHSRGGWVAASLLFGAALLSMAASAESTSARSRAAEWVQLLAPTDDVGRALTLSDNPPAIGALLVRTRGGA